MSGFAGAVVHARLPIGSLHTPVDTAAEWSLSSASDSDNFWSSNACFAPTDVHWASTWRAAQMGAAALGGALTVATCALLNRHRAPLLGVVTVAAVVGGGVASAVVVHVACSTGAWSVVPFVLGHTIPAILLFAAAINERGGGAAVMAIAAAAAGCKDRLLCRVRARTTPAARKLADAIAAAHAKRTGVRLVGTDGAIIVGAPKEAWGETQPGDGDEGDADSALDAARARTCACAWLRDARVGCYALAVAGWVGICESIFGHLVAMPWSGPESPAAWGCDSPCPLECPLPPSFNHHATLHAVGSAGRLLADAAFGLALLPLFEAKALPEADLPARRRERDRTKKSRRRVEV